MPFKDLYAAVQTLDGKISTRDLTTLAIEHSDIEHIKEMWSDVMVDEYIRGFYVEGPLGPPLVVAEKGALIVLSRKMVTGVNGKHWRQFVYTKELMHVFDTAEEKADTEEKFDIQIQRLADPTIDSSPQYRAEIKAEWRALMVLCQEQQRLEFVQKLQDKTVTYDYIAAALRIPALYVTAIFQDNFEAISSLLMEG